MVIVLMAMKLGKEVGGDEMTRNMLKFAVYKGNDIL